VTLPVPAEGLKDNTSLIVAAARYWYCVCYKHRRYESADGGV